MNKELLEERTKIEELVKERELLLSVIDNVSVLEQDRIFERVRGLTAYIKYHKGQIERIISEQEWQECNR